MRFGKTGLFILLALILLGTLFPLLWMFHSSLVEKSTSVTNLTDLFQQNITLKNVTIDYDPLPFTQGTVTVIESDKSLNMALHDSQLEWLSSHPSGRT